MRKPIMKVIALALSVAMLISVIPMYATAAAQKEGVTLSGDNTFSVTLSEELQSDANLAKGATWAGAAQFSTGKKFYARAEQGTGEDKEVATNIKLEKITAAGLYDGIIPDSKGTGQGEVQATSNKYTIPESLKSNSEQKKFYDWQNRILFVNPDFVLGEGGVYTWDSTYPYVINETHYDIILDLNAKYNVNKVVFNFAAELNGTAKDYGVYMSESTDTLFNAESLYYSVEGNNKTVNELNFANENKVKYVAIRITAVNGLTSNTAPYSYLRLSEFGVFGTTANQATTDNDVSDNDGLDATVNSASNIVKGFPQRQITKAESFMVKENDQVVSSDYSSVVNGDFADDGVDANATNVKFAYSFANEVEFNNILLSFAQNPVAEYYIYTSNNADTLFSETNKIHRCNTQNPTNAQYIIFDNTMTAKNIGIELIAANGNTTVNEIAIIGPERELSATDVYYDSEAIAKYDAKLKTTDNLMQTEYYISDTIGTPGTMHIGGALQGSPHKNRGTITTRATDNDIIDGNPDVHADISVTAQNGSRIIFRQNGTGGDDSVWYENTYIDVTTTLKSTATVESIYIAWPSSFTERASDYELFVMGEDGNVKNIYNPQYSRFRIDDNTNKAISQKQVYVLDEPEKIKYIGLRIYRGIQKDAGHNSTYARVAELGVFGTYDNIDYYDYSVSSNVGDFINENGTEILDDTLTYTVPLFKDGYAFKKWTLNDDEADYTVDKVNNTATVKEVVKTNMDLVAVYEDAPTTLSGGNFTKHSELDWILVPKGTFGIDMLYAFDNYKENVAVQNGDAILESTKRVTTGMTVGALSDDGTVTGKLEVVNIGDANLDGDVNVTDLTSAISIAVGDTAPHSEKEEFAIDTNGDGRITVSDVIIARNDILSDNTLENYTTKNTVAAKDLEYKYMGREHVVDQDTADEAIYLEMTASGISFEANFMGDIKVVIASSNTDNEYITAVVDGVANHDISLTNIGYNRKATITLAQDVKPGVHTVEIYKQSETGRNLKIFGIELNGEVIGATENNDLLLEFVGDSITCGNGNLSKPGTNPAGRTQNGYLAYGTLTAQMLGADWSNISKSGSALVQKPGMANNHMPTEYDKIAIGLNLPYDFQNADRKADIVVVNLGTNDQGLVSTMYPNDRAQQSAFFSESAESFARKIIQKNGDNVNIVFAFGLMTDSNHFMNDCYKEVAQKLTAKGYNVWFCSLPKNTDGGADHPNVEGDYAAAEVLSTFIKENVLK